MTFWQFANENWPVAIIALVVIYGIVTSIAETVKTILTKGKGK